MLKQKEMYEFIALSVKCRFCDESLMDNEVLVDNAPGIKLNVEYAGRKGIIHLSSIYGSYNYRCSIDIPKDRIAVFSCPACNRVVNTKDECMTCGGDMVPFHLEMGGKLSICARRGCKNHHVEFHDLSQALRKLYNEYGIHGKKYPNFLKPDMPKDKKTTQHEFEEQEIIETGTFLQSYCPHCRKSLIENDMLKLKISDEEEGFLLLNPYLNSFTSKSTIYLPEDKTAADIRCFHCDRSLVVGDKICGHCGSPVAMINVGASTKLIDFYICTKKGCKWHGLSDEDLQSIKLEEEDN